MVKINNSILSNFDIQNFVDIIIFIRSITTKIKTK